MPSMLHAHTPTLSVADPRGLPVRVVGFYRETAGETAQLRITRTEYDGAGRVRRQWDPRFWSAFEQNGAAPCNQTMVSSLSGTILRNDQVDSGREVILRSDAGEVLEQWDGRGNHRRIRYDEQRRLGAIYEAMQDGTEHCVERFVYGDTGDEAAAHNQCGMLVRHDDLAGTQRFADYSIPGGVLSERRQFLADPAVPNWPEAPAERDALLEAGEGYGTQRVYAALGDLLAQTDARGNIQRHTYGVAGQLTSTTLQQAGQATERVLVSDIAYNAFGQIQTQTLGPGVHIENTYDLADGRLCRLTTTRHAGRSLLQDLVYTYDPVGNMIRLEDHAQPTRYFRNQHVEPVSTYAYDTLNQLTEATGRESARQLSDGSGLPEWLPLDDAQWENYHEWYSYDAGGNLVERRHQGAWHATRTMLVDAHSNRSLPEREGAGSPDFGAGFDACGNQQALEPGQAMAWDTRNQLARVVQVSREDGADDAEIYCYGGNGQRVRKLRTRQAQTLLHSAETRYLPGLELHTDTAGEVLEVITADAGTAGVRVLHWVSGKPEEIDNDQVRYALSDHLGSSTLELDHAEALISQEGYYPYGGTAWWAGRSAIDASYKTMRYSGRERDATGLYYYGYRYYAPWLQRWLNPDPAGDVDGLNLFRMAGNNPIMFVDAAGLFGLDWLDLAAGPEEQEVVAALLKKNYRLNEEYRLFTRRTQAILATAKENTQLIKGAATARESTAMVNRFKYTERKLNDLAAHAGFFEMNGGGAEDAGALTDFVNMKGSLSPKALFPGVELIKNRIRPGLEKYMPAMIKFEEMVSEKKQTELANETVGRIKNTISGFNANQSREYYAVRDVDAYMSEVRNMYSGSGGLHPAIEKRIVRHIERSGSIIPTTAGIAGLHAEVQALNAQLLRQASVDSPFGTEASYFSSMSNTAIMTQRLAGNDVGADFPACFNCSGILSGPVNILTGRVSPTRPITRSMSFSGPFSFKG